MKIVKIMGGLGNQLFQYAFARALEYTSGEPVYLDLSTYEYANAHNGFELGSVFSAPFRIASSEEVVRLATRPLDLLSQIRRKYFTKATQHIDRIFRYDPRVFEHSGDRYYDGFWQTERYFDCVAAELRRDLAFSGDPGEKNTKLVTDKKDLAFLHVRRGDALKNPDTYVCTSEYYCNALKELRARGRTSSLLVFSDDLAWCKNNLPLKGFDAIYVDWNRGAESWRDLWLMSRCGNGIVANSTFSWWGAWLGQGPDSTILAPDRWSLAKPRLLAYYHYTFDEVVPASWLRIPID